MRSGSATDVPPNFCTTSTAIKATGGPTRPRRILRIHSAPVPSADKRARQKENARAAREQREAAETRRKRIRSTTTIAIVAVIFVGVIVLLNVVGSDKKKATPPASTTTTAPAS